MTAITTRTPAQIGESILMNDDMNYDAPPPLTDFDADYENIELEHTASIAAARRWWRLQGGTAEALLAVARAYAEARNVSIPGEAVWEQAAFVLGAIAQEDTAKAAKALHLWRTSPGAAGRLLHEPDDEQRISVTDAAEAAGMTRAYIKADIKAGRLPAMKNATGNWEIRVADFRQWMAKPGRGNRSG